MNIQFLDCLSRKANRDLSHSLICVLGFFCFILTEVNLLAKMEDRDFSFLPPGCTFFNISSPENLIKVGKNNFD